MCRMILLALLVCQSGVHAQEAATALPPLTVQGRWLVAPDSFRECGATHFEVNATTTVPPAAPTRISPDGQRLCTA